ncbi:MAG: helix-turn-helix transcriptional regulator [Nitrospiraceae bacterium]|nr:helix-turn-helix transcriptional regulator [Nitrospiraceae bacterium]
MFKSDKAIGELIRQMRKSSGMSQMQLAEKIGLSYQQVQKYEKGINKLNLSRLKQISGALGVPASLFLVEKGSFGAGEQKAMTGLLNDEAKLLMLYRRLQSKKLKHGFIEMLEDIIRYRTARKADF